jgi:hypothetical protein
MSYPECILFNSCWMLKNSMIEEECNLSLIFTFLSSDWTIKEDCSDPESWSVQNSAKSASRSFLIWTNISREWRWQHSYDHIFEDEWCLWTWGTKQKSVVSSTRTRVVVHNAWRRRWGWRWTSRSVRWSIYHLHELSRAPPFSIILFAPTRPFPLLIAISFFKYWMNNIRYCVCLICFCRVYNAEWEHWILGQAQDISLCVWRTW